MNANEQSITMRPKIKKYLEDIGITEPVQKRIDELHRRIQRMMPCMVTDILVMDYIKKDGTHIYNDVDFHTEKYMLFTVENFLTESKISLGAIQNHIVLLEFDVKDYDLKKANDKSRLTIKIWYDFSDFFGLIKATGRNCDYALEIFRKYYIANIRAREST